MYDYAPALEHHLALISDDHSIARLPRRRLGHVRQQHVGVLLWRLERHRQVAAVVGFLSRDADGNRLLRGRVDDGQRFQEIVDAVARYVNGELPVLDRGLAFVERDAVAVNDDATEHGTIDRGGRGVVEATREQGDEE